MTWMARGLLFLGGVIAGFFVSQDAPNYTIVSFVIGLFLFMSCIALITFRAEILAWIKSFFRK